MPNLFDKEKYVIHYENLQLYSKVGSRLKKIHCELEINQSQWIKQVVEFNTQKWIEAAKNGGKDGKALYKWMNNAVYGKAIKNIRNRINVKLVATKKTI